MTPMRNEPRVLEAAAIASLVSVEPPATTVVEYFTGNGTVTRWLHSLFRHVVSVDIAAVETGEREPSVEVHRMGALEHLETLRDASVIVANGGLHHLSDQTRGEPFATSQREFFHRVAEALRPGGMLVLSDVPPPGEQLSEARMRRYEIPLARLGRNLSADVVASVPQGLLEMSDDNRHANCTLQYATNVAANILESFVDAHRIGGHRGTYTTLDDWLGWVDAVGMEVQALGYFAVPWFFATEREWLNFVPSFFQLRLETEVAAVEWLNRGWLRRVDDVLYIPWAVQFISVRSMRS